MPELCKIKAKISEIARRGNNVTVAEIEAVINQLGTHGFLVRFRTTTHGKLFTVGGRQFMVCCHHRGSRQVKSCYVREFVKAMIELELYDED